MAKVRNMIAFDLGASNGRAILGQFDGEKITMRELHRFENNYIEMNGVFYWDTPYLYNQLKKGLLAFKQGNFGDLDAFGIDTTLTFNTIYQLYRRLREEDPALEIADTMLLTPDLLGYFLTGAKEIGRAHV